MSQTYAPPKVSVGQLVIFRHGPTDRPEAAIVTEVGERAISVSVIPPLHKAVFPKQSVRHISDPDVIGRTAYAEGLWEHTEETKFLMSLMEQQAEPVVPRPRR